MALYVRDDEVDRLAGEVQRAYGSKTKTEAVRMALKRALEDKKKETPLVERLKALQQEVRRLGTPDPDFDQKKYTDEMWGDI